MPGGLWDERGSGTESAGHLYHRPTVSVGGGGAAATGGGSPMVKASQAFTGPIEKRC